MKWISVKDRLPKNTEEVLVAFNHIPEMGEDGICYLLANFIDGIFFSFETSKEIKYATHWMPLPSPPME